MSSIGNPELTWHNTSSSTCVILATAHNDVKDNNMASIAGARLLKSEDVEIGSDMMQSKMGKS